MRLTRVAGKSFETNAKATLLQLGSFRVHILFARVITQKSLNRVRCCTWVPLWSFSFYIFYLLHVVLAAIGMKCMYLAAVVMNGKMIVFNNLAYYQVLLACLSL